MARIPIYSPQESAQPPALSRDQGAGGQILGNAISGFGRTLGAIGDKIEKHDTLVEESRQSAEDATLDAYHTTQWDKIKQNADPKDPDIHNLAAKFMAEVVDPNIQALGHDLRTEGGRRQYEVLAAKARQKWAIITAHDQKILTGEAVWQDGNTFRNATSIGVHTDPTTFEFAVDKAHDERMRLQRAGVDPGKALEWETDSNAQFAQSAVRGLADGVNLSGTPEEVRRKFDKVRSTLEGGRFDKYLSLEQRDSLAGYISRQERSVLESQRADAVEQRRQEKVDADKVAIAIQNSTIDPKTGQTHIPPSYFKDITAKYAQLPGASPEAERAMVDYGRSILREQEEGDHVISDPHTYEDFGKRLMLGPEDKGRLTEQQIYQARIDKKLSTKDASFYLSALENLSKDPAKAQAEKRYQDFLAGMKPSIAKSDMFGNILDSVQAQKWYQFQFDTRQQFDDAYRGGNWQELFDPRSGSYLGNQMPKYTVNAKGALPLIRDRIKGGPQIVAPPPRPTEPRKPGESPADYLKRTGSK